MQKKLLILGGGVSHLAIINIANNMGLHTVVMDKNPAAKGLKIAKKAINLDGGNKEQVLSVAKAENIDGILSTGDYSVIPAAYAAEKINLVSLGSKTANLVTNKGELFSRFAKHGVPIPPRKVVTNFKDALGVVNKIGLPVILKPEYSYGASRGVIRVNSIEEFEKKFKFTQGFCLKKGIIIEKFIDGLEHTIESITINGKTSVLAISDKIRTSNPYCVATSLDYPSKQKKDIVRKLKLAAKKAIAASGIRNGASHIEAISLSGQVYVIDFGGRGGAGGFIPSVVVPRINGVNMMEAMIKIALGEKVGSLKPQFWNSVIYRFFVAEPGIVKSINGIRKAQKISWVVDLKIHVKKGDRIEVLSNQLLRPGYFVVVGKNNQEAEKRAKLIQELVKIKTK
ncbi:ATP-grasp domain-containing protein [Candidatus Nitrosotenuis aquarius]|uniref:ATP-grasp domain-containing protein n=1 Tax=Candidatus Nitrosotenuis aquarius TaxID=1846278 RepID=UPI0013C3229E|nr:ATP-grasp domain-containing protein [Candidatus Nitrosotenuis aquarius]